MHTRYYQPFSNISKYCKSDFHTKSLTEWVHCSKFIFKKSTFCEFILNKRTRQWLLQRKFPSEIRRKELLSLTMDISRYIERVPTKLKDEDANSNKDSQLMSGFLIFIQNDPSLFSACCMAGNTGVKVIPYSFHQTVSQCYPE